MLRKEDPLVVGTLFVLLLAYATWMQPSPLLPIWDDHLN
jgi:hypothetical protein